MMDLKVIGERLRMIRRHLGINQKQVAKATNLTQPAISRLENGEEIYASAMLAILDFYREKISIDNLLDPDLNTDDNALLFCSRLELRQKLDARLAAIAHDLEKSQKQISEIRDRM